MPRLYAISDLHLATPANCAFIERLPAMSEDWLILAGDIGESETHLSFAFRVLGERFARLLWVPGNHELWAKPGPAAGPLGEAKYRRLVELARAHNVATPEDPYLLFEGEGGPCRVALLFLLYDYSFRPSSVPAGQAVRWAMDDGILCSDEYLLQPDPYASRQAWCQARLAYTRPRLEAARGDGPLVLVNHFPLRRDLVRIPLIPRFSIWCGTTETEDWHVRYGARVVVTGHLHVPATDWRDGVRFEEVSLGWRSPDPRRPAQELLREILPGV
jgi:predicted phosphodiesterase